MTYVVELTAPAATAMPIRTGWLDLPPIANVLKDDARFENAPAPAMTAA